MEEKPVMKFTESQENLIAVLNDHEQERSEFDLVQTNAAAETSTLSSASPSHFQDPVPETVTDFEEGASSRHSHRVQARDTESSPRSTKFEDASNPSTVRRINTEEEASFANAGCTNHCHCAQSYSTSDSWPTESESTSSSSMSPAISGSDAASSTLSFSSCTSSGTSESAIPDFFDLPIDKSVTKVRMSTIATLAQLPHDQAARNARKSHKRNLKERKRDPRKMEHVRRTLHEIGGSVKRGNSWVRVEPGSTPMAKHKKTTRGKAAGKWLKNQQKMEDRNAMENSSRLDFVDIPDQTSDNN